MPASIKSVVQKLLGAPLSWGTTRLAHGAHVTRYYMYYELGKVLSEAEKSCAAVVLSISHSEQLVAALGLKNATLLEANYPEYNALNLSAFSDRQFDFVLSDQVLEHVEGNPQQVFDESWRLLKPGGIAVHTTCFINPIHGFPSDFWRFSPDGLRLLGTRFSQIISVGGFGNRAIWLVSALGLRYTPVPHARWHPLNVIATRNNVNWPVSTWIVLRK